MDDHSATDRNPKGPVLEDSHAGRMAVLFAGSDLAHGTYIPYDSPRSGRKQEIKKTTKTIREPATVAMWEQHLRGERPLGIVPIMADGNCWWAVIDVDVYNLSHTDIVREIATAKLPLHVCRSKSGGAHIFVFLREPAPAADLRATLKAIAARLGYGDCEIFPKQSSVLGDEGDVGNWLNMPYFDTERGTRNAVDAKGRSLSIYQFLNVAEPSRTTIAELQNAVDGVLGEGEGDADVPFGDGPPCLQHLAAMEVSEGGRNNALFSMGVYARKKGSADWENKLHEYNQKHLSPPLPNDEVQAIIRSLSSKDYDYKCIDVPLCSHCDKARCMGRQFGVGRTKTWPPMSGLVRVRGEPAVFFLDVENRRIMLDGNDVLDQRNFRRAVNERAEIRLPELRKPQFEAAMDALFAAEEVVDPPPGATNLDHFTEQLTEFLTDRHRAMKRDEILLGKPWWDDESGLIWFQLRDLMRHMLQENTHPWRTRRGVVANTLRKRFGADSKDIYLRGKKVGVYFVRADLFSVQKEPFSVPRAAKSPI